MEQKLKQSTRSTQQLQTVGKDLYLASPRMADLTPAQRQTLKAMSTEKSLKNLQELDASQLTVETCFKGTNVQTALKVNAPATRAALIVMVKSTVEFIDAKKTISTSEQIEMTIKELLKSYPCFTIEDWALCCYNMMKEVYGKYFERLKLAEFTSAFAKYNEAKAPIVQTIRDLERQDFEREMKEAIRYLQPEYATQTNPVAARVQPVEWMRGEDRLTYTEREEMDERAKQKTQE